MLKSSGPNIDHCGTSADILLIYFATLKTISYVASHKTYCMII